MPTLEWYIANGAGFQSALAAVLAGFVFVAITTLLSSPPKNPEAVQRNAPTGSRVKSGPSQATPIATPIYALLVTCFSLIIASYIFASIGGFSHDYEPGSTERNMRPYVAGIFASCILSLGVIVMIFSLILMLEAYHITTYLKELSLIFDGGIVIVVVSVASTVVPPAETLLGVSSNIAGLMYTIGGLALALIPIVAGHLGRKRSVAFDSGEIGTTISHWFIFVMLLTAFYGFTTLVPREWLDPRSASLGDKAALSVCVVAALVGMDYFLYRWNALLSVGNDDKAADPT